MGRGQEERQADCTWVGNNVTMCMFMCWKGHKNSVPQDKDGWALFSLFLNPDTALGLSMQARPRWQTAE